MKIVFPTSLILISIILFFAVVDPLYNDVSKLKGDVATYNTALNNSTELQKTRDALLQKYRNISDKDKNRLNSFLPNTVNNIKFILEIEQIANIHNMPLKNIKFDDEKNQTNNQQNTTKDKNGNVVLADNTQIDSKSYGVFPVEFETEGNYDSFVSFLKDLEHNLRVMDIKSITFEVPDGTDPTLNPNIYNYTLKVETYWLK